MCGSRNRRIAPSTGIIEMFAHLKDMSDQYDLLKLFPLCMLSILLCCKIFHS